MAAQMVKNLPAMQETWIQSLGWEDPQGNGMATHSSILSWGIPWTEEPGGLQSIGLQRVGHDWVTNTNFYTLRLNMLTCMKCIYRECSENRSAMSDSLRPHGLYSARLHIQPWYEKNILWVLARIILISTQFQQWLLPSMDCKTCPPASCIVTMALF